MIRIALTGPSGAGKGYAGQLFSQKGIPVLDTDKVVHALYAGGELPKQIAALFGDTVLSPDGSVLRKALGQIVFSERSALGKLNALVHGAVKTEVSLWLARCEAEGYPAAMVDAPQLFEADMAKDFDCVVAVVAGDETRISRICRRDGIDKASALQRMKNQMSVDEYRRLSHFTLSNEDDSDLPRQIDELINNIFQI